MDLCKGWLTNEVDLDNGDGDFSFHMLLRLSKLAHDPPETILTGKFVHDSSSNARPGNSSKKFPVNYMLSSKSNLNSFTAWGFGVLGFWGFSD